MGEVTEVTLDAWIAALRSGNYKQGRGRLCRIENGNRAHCCLGVLCDIADPNGWRNVADDIAVWGESHEAHYPPPELGITNNRYFDMNRLAGVNDDDNGSFEDIAGILEEVRDGKPLTNAIEDWKSGRSS